MESLRESGYWFPNPNRTRLFFAPKATMLEKGTGYVQNIYVFFMGATFGVTDYITLGGGLSLFPGVDEQLLYLTPKVGFSLTQRFGVAAGAIAVSIPDEDEGSAGILYGVGTYGDSDRNVTLGVGYGYRKDDLDNDAMFMLGLEYRLTRRLAFVSENWTFPGVDQPLLAFGLRFFGEELAFDFALARIADDGDAVFVPYVDFVYNF